MHISSYNGRGRRPSGRSSGQREPALLWGRFEHRTGVRQPGVGLGCSENRSSWFIHHIFSPSPPHVILLERSLIHAYRAWATRARGWPVDHSDTGTESPDALGDRARASHPPSPRKLHISRREFSSSLYPQPRVMKGQASKPRGLLSFQLPKPWAQKSHGVGEEYVISPPPLLSKTIGVSLSHIHGIEPFFTRYHLPKPSDLVPAMFSSAHIVVEDPHPLRRAVERSEIIDEALEMGT